MGGESRGRRRDRSSSLEEDKKRLKKNRRYRKKTYSSEENSSSHSEEERKRTSPDKKKQKLKAKKKSRESQSPEKKKKRRRSSSSSGEDSSSERKSKKKVSKYESEDESPSKKRKKRGRSSRSKSKSPVKEKSRIKEKEDRKERRNKEEKSGDFYDSESDHEKNKKSKEKIKHKEMGRERDEKESKERKDDYRGKDKNGDDQRGKERTEERFREKKRNRDDERDRGKDDEKDRGRGDDRERNRGDEKDRGRGDDRERGRGDGDRDKYAKERDVRERNRDNKETRDKERDKGKSRDRNREDKDRDRDRDRDKYGSSSKEDRYRSKKDSRNDKHDDKGKFDSKSKSEGNSKTEVALDDIEEEMRKRKERVEAWRVKRQHKDDVGDEKGKAKEGKKWSLEDDDDDDNEEVQTNEKQNTEQDVEELDPLDAYMKEVQNEVKKFATFGQAAQKKGKTTTIVTTVVKKSQDEQKESKPEVMEQNQDLMEYSSEEGEKEDILEGNAFAAMKQKKKKELLAADHSKIYYRSFRKSFYVEVPELAKMTPEAVDAFRLELDGIRVVGKGVPKPIRTWAQSGVNNKILEVLKKCNYEKPTPVQAQGIPSIMSGRDVIGIAKTGSGKTLAFLLPMFRHVLDQEPLDENDGPIAIIMSPTRELALQIHKECRKFCKPLGLHAVCIYGGSGISEQIAELKRGAEIIVCTPGRMIDMLTANCGRVTNCRRCTYLVLDEADRMFDMGFEPQVTKIIANIRDDRQTVMFSATFPRQLEGLARKLLKSPIEIEVGGRSIVCSDILQHAVVIEEDNKFLKLLELLGAFQDKGSILIFVEKQDAADVLFKDLLKRGYPCLSLHGGMDQFDRDSTIADFKNGVIKIMVATSVAARGLDVKHLNLVVNYDCPNHYEDYVHRVGRTGRAGNKGHAFTLITPDEGKFAQDIIKAMEASKVTPPDELKELLQEFRNQMKSEGKKIKKDKNKGFGGKGFKFDEEEVAKSNEMKKMQKWSLGLQDSDDEAEAAENAMDKIEDDLNKAFVDSKPKKAPPQLAPGLAGQQPAVIDKDKMKKASSIAARINIKISQGQNSDKTQQAATQILEGRALEQIKGIGLAKQLADKVNAKLNYKAPEAEKDEEGQTEPEKLEKYESEIDINDLPQQARWRITSKETISRVCEVSEAGITVRGSYIPPGTKLKEGDKRLHLYIESLSERAIQIAWAELRRLLKEELIKFESSNYRPQASGRYKVV
eukprot:Seg1321.8 transcript_id=Seg1321.8/GoldUCD/mRNA.D3Y31 product="putative ATP-dependent RNA helicase DDX46" protein_id=Seg1321.8/GoldUCD/D3Y31